MSATIRDIARKTGLSTATVSLALRGLGTISEATRQRVRSVARELGYQPNPAISHALSLVRQPTEVRYKESIAFLLEWPLHEGPAAHRAIFKGATEQARDMGYKIEPVVVSGRAPEHRRVSRILYSQGVRGLIITPRLGSPQPRLAFQWENFTPVEIGSTLWHPRSMHHVGTSDYNKTLEALHLLKKTGYRRIGMAIEPSQNRHQRGVYYAAYLLSQLRQPREQQLPILATTGPWNEKTFTRWVIKERPEVLYVHAALADVIKGWLSQMGLSVPRDISLFCLNIESGNWSGLRRDYEAMGRSGVEMVSLLLRKSQRGIPPDPRCWLVEERWQPGKTLSRPIDRFISRDGTLLPGTLRRNPHSDTGTPRS
jgi:DNA-binding LacI/PurR family transcriptional regulator